MTKTIHRMKLKGLHKIKTFEAQGNSSLKALDLKERGELWRDNHFQRRLDKLVPVSMEMVVRKVLNKDKEMPFKHLC
jgi:hypothetical protein